MDNASTEINSTYLSAMDKKDKRNLALPMTNEQMAIIKSYQAVTNKSNSDIATFVFEIIKTKYKSELEILTSQL